MDKQLNNPLALQEDSILFGMNGAEHGKFKAGFLGVHNLLHVQDRKAAGVNGGGFTSGAWRTRDLNTVLTNNILDASLVNNQIILPSGTYVIEVKSQSFGVDNNQIRLQNITDAEALGYGTHTITANNSSIPNTLSLYDLELTKTTTIELQHICYLTRDLDGFGSGYNLGQGYTVFSDLKIWKLS